MARYSKFNATTFENGQYLKFLKCDTVIKIVASAEVMINRCITPLRLCHLKIQNKRGIKLTYTWHSYKRKTRFESKKWIKKNNHIGLEKRQRSRTPKTKRKSIPNRDNEDEKSGPEGLSFENGMLNASQIMGWSCGGIDLA